jgi:hypothetical protein
MSIVQVDDAVDEAMGITVLMTSSRLTMIDKTMMATGHMDGGHHRDDGDVAPFR